MHDKNKNESNIKPWFDANGKLLSTEQLRKVSASWSGEQWEEYLQFYETPLQEVVLPNYERVTHRFDAASSLERFFNGDDNSTERTSGITPFAVRKALLSLTHKQRSIIVLCVVEDRSLVEVAKLLKTDSKAVARMLERGLERLKVILDPKFICQLREFKIQEMTGTSI